MPDRAETLKKLDRIRVIAFVDLVMLVALVAFLVAGSDAISPIVGPIHGFIVLVLLYLTAVGASEKRWDWIFPVTTLIPIFALFYDQRLRRRVAATV
jgi:hypothetical protein